MSDLVLGSFEHVSLPGFGISNVLAKIDTGAFSGALDCCNIEKVTIDGKPGLRFFLAGNPDTPIETTKFVQRHVRSASGHREKRYVVDTEITIKNQTYPISIGITDRSTLRCPVLIGRRFLRKHGMLVDVRINEEFDSERELAS